MIFPDGNKHPPMNDAFAGIFEYVKFVVLYEITFKLLLDGRAITLPFGASTALKVDVFPMTKFEKFVPRPVEDTQELL